MDVTKRALAYRIKCLARNDKPIPFDLYVACDLAGLDPEGIYEDEQQPVQEDIILDDPALYFDDDDEFEEVCEILDPMEEVIRLNSPAPCRFYDEE